MERDQSLEFMHNLLRLMLSRKASDLFVAADFPPAIKVDGRLTPVSNQKLTPQHTRDLARAIMNDRQAAEFEATKECNFAISPAEIGRFRVNAFVQQGRVRVLASTGDKRSALTPNTPTMSEAGYPELSLAGWNALYAPAGTSAEIIDRLNAATGRALENADIRAKLAALGVDLAFSSPRELGAFTRAEIERYRKLVAMAQLKPE